MLTVAQAAKRAGRNPETVRRWIREGKLTAWKVGSQHVIDEDDLTNTLREGGPPRRGQPGIIEDKMDRAIVSAIHQGRAERMAQIAEAVSPYAPRAGPRDQTQSDEWLPAIVGRVVRATDPIRIVLFGARARGEGGADADYELLIVLDEVRDRMASRVAVRRSFADLPAPADIAVASAREIEEGPSGLVHWALEEGRNVYERDHVN